jgi:hypothetical protein
MVTLKRRAIDGNHIVAFFVPDLDFEPKVVMKNAEKNMRLNFQANSGLIALENSAVDSKGGRKSSFKPDLSPRGHMRNHCLEQVP